MDLGLTNKIAIVTGASKGMGLSVSKELLKTGAKVMMVSRSGEKLEELTFELRNKGFDVDYVVGDVSSSDLHQKVINKTIKKWGKVHILINNAGGPPMGSFLEKNDIDWDSAFQTNLMSVIRFSKAVAFYMKKNKWGRIISITSSLAIEPTPNMVLSSTIRAGVSSFSKAIATELAQDNITVNVLCPGGVLTDRLKGLVENQAQRENKSYEELLKKSELSIPVKRFASVEEIANTILFLSSEKASYITGVSLAVDGGLLKSF